MGIVDGKAGLVTGAAGGIGRGCAIGFAQEGASVVVCDLESKRAEGEETVRQVEAVGGQAIFVAADVSSEEDQRRLVDACVSRFGRLDFAHNNAGVAVNTRAEDTTLEDWDHTMNVNLKGVWLGMKHQIAQMRRQGGGAIVNTASTAGLMGTPGIAAYSASKFGVIGLTKAVALEVADGNIRVNCICPGAIRTPMVEALTPAEQEFLTRPQAFHRLGEPSEVAAAVVWLASDRSSIVTGAAYTVDLGMTAGIVVREA